MYESLTKYLDVFKEERFGEWVIDENKVHFPYVNYDEAVRNFLGDVMAFVDAHEEMRLTNYYDILEDLGIEPSAEAMAEVDPDDLDGRAVMAFIVASMRGERFCDGFLLHLLLEGCVVKWLKRLDEIDGDEQASNRRTIEEHKGTR